MSQASLRSASAKDMVSNLHQVTIPSNAPNTVSVTIPRMDAGSEHFVLVLIGKMETDLCFLRPYFEAFVPASRAALAAADAAVTKHKQTDLGDGPPSSYVSDTMKQRAGVTLYFSTNPPDAKNLTTYDWTESVSTSRRKRLKSAVAGSNGRQKVGSLMMGEATTTASIAVGPALDSDDDEDPMGGSVAQPPSPLGASRADSKDASNHSSVNKDKRDAALDDVVFGISQVQNCFYIGVYAPIALRNVDITVVANVGMKARDDVRHPLRMCRMHTVCGETFDAAVDWIAKKRTMLVQGLLSLTVDSCEASVAGGFLSVPSNASADGHRTFLHEIMEHLGDPRYARMLLKHCSRFLRKDEKELTTGRTALHTLFAESRSLSSSEHRGDWHARVVEVGSCEYYRTLELLRLLVEEANVSLTEEDMFGNTAVHYAACGHRQSSELLPVLLIMGASPSSVNLSGRRPVDELLARQNAHDQMTWDVDEALALLQQYGSSPTAMITADDPDAVAEGEIASSCTADRRRDVAQYLGHGVDLPRKALKLVDVVPMKVRPFGSDSNTRQFPTPVVSVDAAGYPVRQTQMPEQVLAPTTTTDGGAPTAAGTSYVALETLAMLKAEFASLDREGNGHITVSDMRRAYLSFDGYGVAESTAEIDKTISVMGIRKDGLVSFDEYCVLMLRMNRL